MELDIVTQIIGTLGFPIFVALYHMYFLNKTIKKQTEILNELKILIKERR